MATRNIQKRKSSLSTTEAITEETVPTSTPISRKKMMLVVGSILLVVLVLYLTKSLFIAAIVNGEPISRLSVISQLEKESGKRTLEAVITQALILQEARKQNVSVSNQEVDDQLKKIEETLSKQGQNLDQVLVAQNISKESVKEQIRLEKLIEKMVGKDIKVTDKEINDYMEKNSDLFPEGVSSKDSRQQAIDQIKQQKLSEKVQTWLSKLRDTAKTTYFVQY